MKLIFLHGLPGVGKLTVARELEKLTGFKVFHNHLTVDLVITLFDFGSPPFVELREKIWHDVFIQAVSANVAGLIFTFALDRSVTTNFIRDTRDVVESAGGEVLFVELTCSNEELEKRIEDPARHRFGKLNSVSHFRELKNVGAFVDPGIPKDRVLIDTTELSPSATASLIVNRLDLRKRHD